MIVRISLSLCIIKDMWTIYLFHFDLLTTLKNLIKYLNTKHANIKFISEKEVNRSLPFLNVVISRNKKGFTATV